MAGELWGLEVAEIIEELKKRGYRISKPKPKVEGEFKPFKVFVKEWLSSFPEERTVIREARKRVFVKTDYGERQVEKEKVFQYDPKITEIVKNAEERTDKLDEQIGELEQQKAKIEDEAREKIDKRLKPVYPKEGE